MAVLLPPIDWGFISRLSKDYDFYFEHGRCIVRIYPRHIRQPGSSLQRATWDHLRRQQAIWNWLGQQEHDCWKRLTQGSTWRARDYHARLVLKHIANPDYQWTSARQVNVDYFPGGHFGADFLITLPTTWAIRYRIDLPGKIHNPASWNHIGHKIRNNRYLRKWSLDLDLPLFGRTYAIWPWNRFIVSYPPQPSRIWYQVSAPWWGAPPDRKGQSGLYYFDVPPP